MIQSTQLSVQTNPCSLGMYLMPLVFCVHARVGAPRADKDALESASAVDAHVRLAAWLVYERQHGSGPWSSYCRLLPSLHEMTDAGAFWSKGELQELQFNNLMVSS